MAYCLTWQTDSLVWLDLGWVWPCETSTVADLEGYHGFHGTRFEGLPSKKYYAQTYYVHYFFSERCGSYAEFPTLCMVV